MGGWEGGYLRKDRVGASSLGSISLSKYGGFCYCRALFSRPVNDQGESWRVGGGAGVQKKEIEWWEKVQAKSR